MSKCEEADKEWKSSYLFVISASVWAKGAMIMCGRCVYITCFSPSNYKERIQSLISASNWTWLGPVQLLTQLKIWITTTRMNENLHGRKEEGNVQPL